MLPAYIRNAARTFRRAKVFTVINILGLAIGISAAIVIFWIADYELSFDRFEPDRDRIYKVVQEGIAEGHTVHAPAVPAPLGQAMQAEVTGLELTVPLFNYPLDLTTKVTVPHSPAPRVFTQQRDIVYTTPEYFQLVPYKWLAGSPQSSMSSPFTVVLTESRARLYFPGEPADAIVGKTLLFDKDMTLTVSGIVQEPSEHTDLGAAGFISYATIAKTNAQKELMMSQWNDWMSYSQLYCKLEAGTSRITAESRLNALYKKYRNPGANDPAWSLKLLPLADLHFSADYHGLHRRVASKPALYGLLAIAGFLLLLAVINFINLSTAQATSRAKEIGVRKTMGAGHWNLIRHSLGETLMLVTGATLLSAALTPLIIAAFSGFVPADLEARWWHHPGSLLFLTILIPLVTLLAGSYPAFILSGFNPVKVLKDQHFSPAGHNSSIRLRRILTVGQFVIAQFFIITTLVVGKQIDYGLNQDLGFRHSAILTFETPWDTTAAHRQQLLAAVKAIPQVEMVSTGAFSPGDAGNAIGDIQYKPRPDLHIQVTTRWGDSNYLRLYDLKLLAGRNVRSADSLSEALINNTYARMLGFQDPGAALGHQLSINGKDVPIVGVMADFHEESMHQAILPLAFSGQPGNIFHIRLRITATSAAQTAAWTAAIGKLQKAFHTTYPEALWQYRFLDDTIAAWYKTEQNTIHLLSWATGLTVLVSCLGLLGLVLYTTSTRTKEIGIRKVLGATVTNIIGILSMEFIRLVILASIIAAPIAWWAIHRWLQNFAYRTPVSAWIFIAGGLLLLLMALITLSAQTIRTALANPVESLRTE